MAERNKSIIEALLGVPRTPSSLSYVPPKPNSVVEALLGRTGVPRPPLPYLPPAIPEPLKAGPLSRPPLPPVSLRSAFGQDMATLPSRLGNAMLGPVGALDRFGRTLTNQQGGWTSTNQVIDDANTLAGFVSTGGYAVPKPPSTLGIFGGKRAVTANLAALERAKQLESLAAPPEKIYKETGWFKGADGDWRFEIDDSTSNFNEWASDNLLMGDGQVSGKASDIFDHPALFAAYPELKRIDAKATIDRSGEGLTSGGYSGANVLSGRHNPVLEVMSPLMNNGEPSSLRATMLHELQHGVQDLEGFARGGNPSDDTLGVAQRAVASKAEADYNRLAVDYAEFVDDWFSAKGINDNTATPQDYKNAKKAWQMEHPNKAYEFDKAFKVMESKGPRAGYHHLAGEVEARNVANRQNLTSEHRRRAAPWLTQDVPDAYQIVRRKLST